MLPLLFQIVKTGYTKSNAAATSAASVTLAWSSSDADGGLDSNPVWSTCDAATIAAYDGSATTGV